MDLEQAYAEFRAFEQVMGMTWNDYFREVRIWHCKIAEGEGLLSTIAQCLTEPSEHVTQWIRDASIDPERRDFLSIVLRYTKQPHSNHVAPIVGCAIYSLDPSRVKFFLRPAIAATDGSSVVTTVIPYLASSYKLERFGACYCLPMLGMLVRRESEALPGQPTLLEKLDLAAEQHRTEWLQIRTNWRLSEFVKSQDQVTRLNLIGTFSINHADYPPEQQPLVDQAILAARRETNEYVRRTLNEQLEKLHTADKREE